MGVDEAVIVDAVRSGAPTGTIHRFDAGAGPLPASLRGVASTHHVGLAEALELARALGRLPARTTVYGIEGISFDAGAPVSAPVVAAIDEVVVLARADA